MSNMTSNFHPSELADDIYFQGNKNILTGPEL